MSEIDWSKAPEWATHYDMAINAFCSCKGYEDPETGKYHEWLVDRSGHMKEFWDQFIPRPTKQKWDGGLPPVGSYSRISRKNDVRPSDLVVKIVCYTGQLVVVQNEVGTEYALCKDQVSFGPEISKAERQREELAHLIDENYGNSGTGIADAILSRYNLDPKP